MIGKYKLAPGTNTYVEKEIIPKLDTKEYEILKQLGKELKEACEKPEV